MTVTVTGHIESVLKEKRLFKPKAQFSQEAHIKSFAQYKKLYSESVKNPEKFWAKIAGELVWFKKWTRVLDWKYPFARWFVGGKTNISYNCLDQNLASGRRTKAAIIWEGEPGGQRVLTYQDLHREVCKFANVLKGLGIQKGDRVAIYMPMLPELPIAMLACARIGAMHSVIFAGFSADAIRDRINDSQAKLVVTADGGFRRGGVIPLKANVDEALKSTPSVQNVVVLKRTGTEIHMTSGRDWSWSELKEELRQHVTKEIGALAKPDDIRFTDALPKTRSGKIMRRLLREIAAGSQTVGDVTTLKDLSVLEKIRAGEEE
jgi:acetyl-CoA synthetase